MKKLILFVLIVLSYQLSFAQNFEGEVIFKITYENLTPEMESQMAMAPSEFNYQIKNQRSRMEMKTMMGATTTITDNTVKQSTVLMDMMGQKMKMTIDMDDANEIVEKTLNNIHIDYIDGTKEIAGYTCKKAIMEVKDDEGENSQQVVFYYTEDIAPIDGMQGFKGVSLKGMPLEYSIDSQGVKVVFTATLIEKKSIDDSVFEIPDGYTEMPESMKKAMQQQR